MIRLTTTLVVAALVAGCGSKVTGIVFTVDASGPVDGVARLHGTATLNGGAPATIDLPHTPDISIPPSVTFALQLPDNATGTVDVQLEAQADDGTVLASGGGSATILARGVQRSAQVMLTPAGSGLVFDSSMNDFGAIELAMSSAPFTFTATNMGTDQTGTPSVTIDGANPGDFTFTTDCDNPVPAAGTCTVDVTFAPTAMGARAATLHLTATPGGEATALLTGTGMMPTGAAFSIAPKSFLFNDTPEMTTGNSTTFTVTNVGGSASPALGNSMLVGGMTASYAITTDGCFARVLQPNDTCTVTVQFKPATAGLQISTLTVASAGAALNGRGQGIYHAEQNTNGTNTTSFWFGAFAPSIDEIVGVGDSRNAYVTAGGTPATFTTFSVAGASGSKLGAVWGPSRGSVYTVDAAGDVLRYSGGVSNFAVFNAGSPLPSGCCSGIWGFSDTNFYVVGGGVIEHYDGTWHPQTVSATSPVVNAVWGSAPNNLFAVGNGGLILHNGGADDMWTQQVSGTTYDLRSISGSGASDIYAVGYSPGSSSLPVILHYDGTSWKEQSSGLTMGQPNSVWVAPDGEAWIADTLDAILYSNGNGTWIDESSVGNLEKWQVTGTSDHDVYIFSEDGNVFHYY